MTPNHDRTLFRWSSIYTVGVPQIDEEHQQLFRLAQQTHEAMLDGCAKEVLSKRVAELIDYTCYHFAHEEQLMQRAGYPEYPQHRRLHEELRSRAVRFRERLESGEITMTIEFMQFLAAWLKRHTTTSDLEIVEYMRRSGATPDAQHQPAEQPVRGE